MAEETTFYYIENADFLARLDFNGKIFFRYAVEKNDPRIKKITHKRIAIVDNGFDSGDITMMNGYMDKDFAARLAEEEIVRIYPKLSDEGKIRADKEIARIREMTK